MHYSEKDENIVGFPEVLLKHLCTEVTAFSLSSTLVLKYFPLYLKLHLKGSVYSP